MRSNILDLAALLVSSAALAELDPAVKQALDQGCVKVAKENASSPCRGVANLTQFKLMMAHVKVPEEGHTYCMAVCEKMRTEAGLPHIPAPGEPGARRVTIPTLPKMTIDKPAPAPAAAAPAVTPTSDVDLAKNRFTGMFGRCEALEAQGQGREQCSIYLDSAMEAAQQLRDASLIDKVTAKRKALGLDAK